MIKDLYKNKEAKQWRENHGDLEADQDLGERVYTSRLIGFNPDLVMHGGGNTSVKVQVKAFAESKNHGKRLACTADITFVAVIKDENGKLVSFKHNLNL